MTEEAERLGAAIRERSGAGPLVPPSTVASALGVDVRVRQLPGGLRGYTVVGRKKILVAPLGYRPREEFTIAHELVEASLEQRLPGLLHEGFCDRAAGALLLPATDFIRSMACCQFDVPAVRRAWPWASYETIIWRASELLPGVTATKWLNGQPVERRAHGAVSEVSTAEFAALRETLPRGRGMAYVGNLLALAWRLAGKGEHFRAVSLCLPA